MRIRILATLFLASSLFVNNASFAASPKAGSSCSKAGLTQFSAGKKFTCVKSGKKLVWNKGVIQKKSNETQVPSSSSNEIKMPENKEIPAVTYMQSSVIAGSDLCKVKDARIIKTQPNNSGFPLTPDLFPVSGNANFVIIPIEFPDAKGENRDLDVIEDQTRSFQNWFNYFSQSKLKINVQYKRTWYQVPRNSTAYTVGKNGPNEANSFGETWNKYAQEFLDSAKKDFDFSNVHGVIFHLSRNQKSDISHEILGRGVNLLTNQGTKNLFYWASGNYHYQLEAKQGSLTPDYWAALWVHEVLHSMGISLHAPGNGFFTGVGQNQGGTSWALDAWELFKLGWFNENQVYCLPSNLVSDQIVFMQPIETEGDYFKTIIIPTSDTKALVVESRRSVGYSKSWPSNTAGVFVYELDATLDNDRSKECCGDSGNDPTFSKWSFYLPTDQRPVGKAGNPGQLWLSYLVQPLESVTHNGIKISYLQGGAKDVIKISKS